MIILTFLDEKVIELHSFTINFMILKQYLIS